MDTSDKWFRLDNRGGPIWGSRGREFKSRQPDKYLTLSEGQFEPRRDLENPADFGSDRHFDRH
jgi:hypothetical protein